MLLLGADNSVVQKILASNKAWSESQAKTDPSYFKNAIKGQNPSIVYIGCSDSRVATDLVTGSHPGEIFTHRNIANSVTINDNDTLAVLQYAIEHLKIKDIVVSGHTYCGGIGAVINGFEELGGALEDWLTPIKTMYDDNKKFFDKIKDPYQKSRALTEMNVERVVNLVNDLDFIKDARKSGQVVRIHGLIYLMETGRFVDLGLTQTKNSVRLILTNFGKKKIKKSSHH
ncbi:Carbonic anhydrase 2 [Smittium culicis]|uniref:Carbonic anhydrase n=1 Tax=Smittium culicis TaxID=133412 RepID=A0A1R1Y4V7_9FUNG|nr:Carbonic anhydrase 2 [Smittium culicis]